MIRNFLVGFAFLLLIGLSAIDFTTSVNDFKVRHTEQQTSGFVDPAVYRRAKARHEDTIKWHEKSCKDDPLGYDCKVSGQMLRDEGPYEPKERSIKPRRVTKTT